MDNLTHSLIGAAIGQTGLKKLSGLGMATLIIAANIPDIDAACFLWLEGHEHLAFRRGITHGPPAMLILPALLTAAMIGFDRWQSRLGTRPDARLPVRAWQLFLLALIGTMSHPAADWLNNYGVRLLEPFSSRWFYGDTLFIIDVWLWAILIGGCFWSRRAEKGAGNWMRRGRVVATVAGLYVFANGAITSAAEGQALSQWHARIAAQLPGASFEDPLIVASPPPIAFWRRDIFWRDGNSAGSGKYSLLDGMRLTREQQAHNADDPRLAAVAARDPQIAAYLFWARMPMVGFDEQLREMILIDQRFTDPRVGDRFTARATIERGP
jgi:inner membrane protein